MVELQRCYCPASVPESPPEGFSRLYFGAEFCFWRLPANDVILAALEWSRRADWQFTLVTPVLNQSEFPLLKASLQRLLPQFAAVDEVLISDWGTLELVRGIRTDLPLILGRVLSAQKRDPAIGSLVLNSAERGYFQSSAWHNRGAIGLLSDLGMARVELDSLVQGLAPLPHPLRGSLHLPFAMVTSSRNCPFRKVAAATPCPAPCGDVFRLRGQHAAMPLLQAGNTQFVEHAGVPADLLERGIDRLVIHPQVPR